MKPSLGLVVKPPTKRGVREALKIIRTLRPEALFLNLPKSLEDSVSELSQGMSYEEFLEEVSENSRLPEPRGAWIAEHEPILRELPNLGDVKVHCYGDDLIFRERAETAVRITLLTFRDAVRDKVSVREWIKILRREASLDEVAVERESEHVAELGQGYERILCISGFEAKELRKRLQNLYETWIKYLGQPYHFQPLDILRRIMEREMEVDEETVEQLIREHIKFIRKYVYYMPLLDAAEKWASEKLYWILKPWQRDA